MTKRGSHGEATIDIAAPPEVVYGLVADITRMASGVPSAAAAAGRATRLDRSSVPGSRLATRATAGRHGSTRRR